MDGAWCTICRTFTKWDLLRISLPNHYRDTSSLVIENSTWTRRSSGITSCNMFISRIVHLSIALPGEFVTFSLLKAIKSTHRSPINRFLHVLGIPMYVTGIMLILDYFLGLHTSPVTGIALWLIANCLFLTGHKIEGNLRAMTLIIIFK